VVQGAAALFWLPQAALLAMAVQGLASGQGMAAVLWPACAILVLGLLRAGCEAWGARRTFGRARAQLSALRAQTAAALAGGSPLDRGRAPSGQAASVLAEQAEALVPYLVRYQPARWRVMVVPLFILFAVASFSWVAALVLLVAAPLIPVFMAIVGWRAKAASEAQMVEMGGMNAFLLDRLRGLATCARSTRWTPRRSAWAMPRNRCAAHDGGAAHRLPVVGRAGACSPRWAWRWWRRMSASTCWARSTSAPGAGS
jgi:ATP-binding cassette subfamily C protein CydD